ncbi:cation diffusion facilitator family transporter [Miniphocaeibacter halophilus]|uniref:Cation transporter n=1 Tax=Miniphocaeibacter halophilus TaxID=2931922 RepID=A0AC61MPF7_9FIRM|nr:cation diffusion facilitator family transporter [Miniphocaeibacter halophilus]QQK07417.1 cation transporter [Miniphocaeibacter halophilus]
MENKETRNKYIKKSGIIGLFLNLLLFVTKLIIGLLINSVAVISDAFNNLADSMSSVITLIGSFLSAKPADKEHPYGHGRSEYISSLVVSFFILFTGISLLKESVIKIIYPEEIKTGFLSIIILVFSICVKIFMYRYNSYIGKKIDSLALISVAKDALSDIFSTSGIIISILIYKYGDINLDGYIGLLVSIIILKSGYDIAMDSINVILGEAPPEELEDKIEKILLSGKNVQGVHKLELHEYGKGNIYGSVHLDFPCNLIFKEVHEVADDLENKILNQCGVRIVIHMDPVNCLESDEYANRNTKN